MSRSLMSREEWPELYPREVDRHKCRDCRDADPTGPNNHRCVPDEQQVADGFDLMEEEV